MSYDSRESTNNNRNHDYGAEKPVIDPCRERIYGTTGLNTERCSRQPNISPPPLKRRRIGSRDSRSFTDSPKLRNSESPLSTNWVKLGQVGSNDVRSGDVRTPPSKPFCRACGKSNNVKFNPIISCSYCSGKYHDSCRQPALGAGLDPQRWRCSRCLSRSKKLTSKINTTPCTSGEVLLKPLSSNHPCVIQRTQPRRSLPGLTGAVTKEICNVKRAKACSPQPIFDGHKDEQPTISKTKHDYSKLAFSPIYTSSINNTQSFITLVKPAASETESRTEIPNTPTQNSSQLNISSCGKPLPSTEETVVSEFEEVSLVDELRPSAETSTQSGFCFTCRKQRPLVNEQNQRSICRSCQRSTMLEREKLVVPETPGSSSTSSQTSLPCVIPVIFGVNINSTSTSADPVVLELPIKTECTPPKVDLFEDKIRLDTQKKLRCDWDNSPIQTLLPLKDRRRNPPGPVLSSKSEIASGLRVQIENTDHIGKLDNTRLTLAPKLKLIVDVGAELLPPRDEVVESKIQNGLLMPFERLRPKKPPKRLSFDYTVVKETSYQSMVMRSHRPLIETMTEAEKARRIATITARPSRKNHFGSDYRLAHKRRYGLNDIHDETGGTPHPALGTLGCHDLHDRRSIEMKEGIRTLRQVFELPDNAIPMNDGHTELAFRDGTRVNGRLPRPRNIYKVGKRLGGELTVRAS